MPPPTLRARSCARLRRIRARIHELRVSAMRCAWRLVRVLMVAGAAMGPAPPPSRPPEPDPTAQIVESAEGEDE